MTCPKCEGCTKIYDCRSEDGRTKIRRRECLECGHRFKTIEMMVEQFKKFKEEMKNGN